MSRSVTVIIAILLLLSVPFALFSCVPTSQKIPEDTVPNDTTANSGTENEVTSPNELLVDAPGKFIYWIDDPLRLIRWVDMGKKNLDPNHFAEDYLTSDFHGEISYLIDVLKSYGLPLLSYCTPELIRTQFGVWDKGQTNEVSLALFMSFKNKRHYLTVDCDYIEESAMEQAKENPLAFVCSRHSVPSNAEEITFQLDNVVVPALAFSCYDEYGQKSQRILFVYDNVIFTVRGTCSIIEIQDLLKKATLRVTADWSLWGYTNPYPGDVVAITHHYYNYKLELNSDIYSTIETIWKNGEWIEADVYATKYFSISTTYEDVVLTYCPYTGIFVN